MGVALKDNIWCLHHSYCHYLSLFSILLTYLKLLFRCELGIHEKNKWVYARHFSRVHLLAYQIIQMSIVFILLFPITALQFCTAELCECVCQIYPYRNRFFVVLYRFLYFSIALHEISHSWVRWMRLRVNFYGFLVEHVCLIKLPTSVKEVAF